MLGWRKQTYIHEAASCCILGGHKPIVAALLVYHASFEHLVLMAGALLHTPLS